MELDTFLVFSPYFILFQMPQEGYNQCNHHWMGPYDCLSSFGTNTRQTSKLLDRKGDF